MITSLRLQNFRSYKDASFEFDPGVNIIVGPNASGKTNLLEAILVLASGKSYRARDAELVRSRAHWARLDGFFDQQNRVLKLKLEDAKIDKSFEINNQIYRRLNLERTEPIVLFEPGHLQLLARGPEYRRQFFDDILERSQMEFKPLAGRYRRVLAQRNALLKQPASRARQQLFVWDVRLAELGGQIALARAELITDINKMLARTYGRIAGQRAKAEVVYDSSVDPEHYSSRLLKKLAASVDRDFALGFTSAGPHREDFQFLLKSQPAAQQASRGEVRSLILALKIFELKLIEKARDRQPILLLDDVFSELDGARRRHLVSQLGGYQTIITTTDADAVMEYFSEQSQVVIV